MQLSSLPVIKVLFQVSYNAIKIKICASVFIACLNEGCGPRWKMQVNEMHARSFKLIDKISIHFHTFSTIHIKLMNDKIPVIQFPAIHGWTISMKVLTPQKFSISDSRCSFRKNFGAAPDHVGSFY